MLNIFASKFIVKIRLEKRTNILLFIIFVISGYRNILWQFKGRVFFTVMIISNETSCSERLWNLHFWRYSKLSWTRPQAIYLTLKLEPTSNLVLHWAAGWSRWWDDPICPFQAELLLIFNNNKSRRLQCESFWEGSIICFPTWIS